MKRLLCGVVLCGLAHPAWAGEIEALRITSKDAWQLTDFSGGTPAGAQLTASPEGLVLSYRRETIAALVHNVSLADLSSLRLHMQSDAGAAFELTQQYPYEHGVMCTGAALLRVTSSTWVRSFGLYVGDGAAFEAEKTTFLGGMTCDARPRGRISLVDVTTPGEFVIGAADLSMTRCVGVLIWLVLGSDAAGTLAFPPGDRVEAWEPGLGLKVKLQGCFGMLWGIISMPGCKVDVQGSDLVAAGHILGGDAQVTLKDLHNRREMEDATFDLSDRRVRFLRSKVGAWNFYADGKARITLDHCTYGESHAGADSRLEVRDSFCDGTGGFIQGSDRSEIRLVRCRITCAVSARDDATIVLEDCDVTGDVAAAARSKIRLVRTRVIGTVRQFDAGMVERE